MNWASRAADAFMEAVAPERQLRRMAARHRIEKVGRIKERMASRRRDEFSAGGYQSTENSRDAASWLTSNLSADSALELDRETMCERVDSAVKNFELASNHVEGRVTRVAGSGMTVQPEIGLDLEDLSEADEKEYDGWNETLRVNWERTCERIGKHGEELWEIQQQAARDYERRGEFFVLVGDEYDPLAPTSLKIELIDPDRISTPNGMAGDKSVRLGIKLDAKGRAVGCYIQETHPNDTISFKQRWKFEPFYLPNGLPRVIHHFTKVWPGQHRGFPMMQVGVRRLKNKEEYADAELERLLSATCVVGFVRTEFDPDETMDSHGVVTDSNGVKVKDMSPGKFYYGDGDEITFNNPNGPTGAFAPYQEHEGRMFAAGCNTHYEILAGDWKQMSYSNARLLFNVEDATVYILQLGHEKLVKWVYRHFVTRAINEDLIPVDPIEYRSDPWFYWASRVIYPPKASIDPPREDRNEMMQIEAGMKPAGEMAERLNGKPTRQIYAAVKRDRKLREKYGLEVHMPQMNRDQELMPEEEDGAPTQIGDGNRASSDSNSARQAAGAVA